MKKLTLTAVTVAFALTAMIAVIPGGTSTASAQILETQTGTGEATTGDGVIDTVVGDGSKDHCSQLADEIRFHRFALEQLDKTDSPNAFKGAYHLWKLAIAVHNWDLSNCEGRGYDLGL